MEKRNMNINQFAQHTSTQRKYCPKRLSSFKATLLFHKHDTRKIVESGKNIEIRISEKEVGLCKISKHFLKLVVYRNTALKQGSKRILIIKPFETKKNSPQSYGLLDLG